MRKQVGFALALAAAAFGAHGIARAGAVPTTIDQQGRVLKVDGSPETVIIPGTLAIYDAATGGNALWTETQQVGLDMAGFYAAALGSTTPFPKGTFDGKALFLGVTIMGESEMTPRQPLMSVPYAMKSTEAEVA